jgi:hypothetical protein
MSLRPGKDLRIPVSKDRRTAPCPQRMRTGPITSLLLFRSNPCMRRRRPDDGACPAALRGPRFGTKPPHYLAPGYELSLPAHTEHLTLADAVEPRSAVSVPGT